MDLTVCCKSYDNCLFSVNEYNTQEFVASWACSRASNRRSNSVREAIRPKYFKTYNLFWNVLFWNSKTNETNLFKSFFIYYIKSGWMNTYLYVQTCNFEEAMYKIYIIYQFRLTSSKILSWLYFLFKWKRHSLITCRFAFVSVLTLVVLLLWRQYL